MAKKTNMTVPSKWQGQEKKFAETIKESVDSLLGQRGDILDKAVTVKDLVESGLATIPAGAQRYSGASNGLAPVGSNVNLNIQSPNAPTNLTASGAFQNILLAWNLTPYNGHSAVFVYRHTSDSLSNATKIGLASGGQRFFSDPVGGNKTFYYWIRAINENGEFGAYNSSAGTLGVTLQDNAVLLNSLADSITSSELATSLSTPIAAIGTLTADVNTAGSVAHQLASEASARATAIGTEAQARATAISTEAQARSDAIDTLQSQVSALSGVAAWDSATTYAQNDLATASGNLYKSKSNNNQNNAVTNSTYWEDIGTYTTLADAVSANQASITQINTVDATSTSALTSQFVTLQSAFSDPTTGLSAATGSIAELNKVDTSTNSAAATRIQALEAALFSKALNATAWADGVSYVVSDQVYYQAALYTAASDHTSSSTNKPPSSSWTLADVPALGLSSAITALDNKVFNDNSTLRAASSELTELENVLFVDVAGVQPYSATKANYVAGDRVSFDKKIWRYKSTTSVAGQSPSSTSIYWELDVVASSKALTDLTSRVFDSGTEQRASSQQVTDLENTLFIDVADVQPYDATKADYVAGNRVSFNKKIWRYKNTSSVAGQQPDTATAYWERDYAASSNALSALSSTVSNDSATSQQLTQLENAIYNDAAGASDYDATKTDYVAGDRVVHDRKFWVRKAGVAQTAGQTPASSSSFWLADTLSSSSATTALIGVATSSLASSQSVTDLQNSLTGASGGVTGLSNALSTLNTEVFTDPTNQSGSRRATADSVTALNTTLNNITDASDWVSGGNYIVGDRRLYDKKIYRCIQAVSGSATTPDNDGTHWLEDKLASANALSVLTNTVSDTSATAAQVTQLSSRLYGANAWLSTGSYSTDDLVVYAPNQRLYKALQNSNSTNSQQPDTASTYWQEQGLSSSGISTLIDTKLTENTESFQKASDVTGLISSALEPNGNIATATSTAVSGLETKVYTTPATRRASSSQFTALRDELYADVVGLSPWVIGSSYQPDARVIYLGVPYINSSASSLSGQIPSVTTADPSLAVWTSTRTYYAGDVVIKNESGVYKAYLSSGESEGKEPPDGTYWTYLQDYNTPPSNSWQKDSSASSQAVSNLTAEVFDSGGSRLATASSVNGLSSVLQGSLNVANWNPNSFGYALNDLVKYITATYVCISAHTSAGNHSSSAGLSATLWQEVDHQGSLLARSATYDRTTTLVEDTENGLTATSERTITLQGRFNDLGGTGSSVEAAFSTQANQVGDLQAGFTVKTDINGNVAGFGLASTGNVHDNSSQSRFLVNADNFAIMPPSSTVINAFVLGSSYSTGDFVSHGGKFWIFKYHDSSGAPVSNFQISSLSSSPDGFNSSVYWEEAAHSPFTVQTTDIPAVFDANGNELSPFIPRGVYINTARIKHAAITTAHIQNATMDMARITGKLSANQIDTNSIEANKLVLDNITLQQTTLADGTKALQVKAIDAGIINAGTLNGNNVTITNLYASNIAGDINTINPFSLNTPITLGASNTIIFEGQQPAAVANAAGVSHSKKVFVSASGWGIFSNDETYKAELWMRDNAVVSNQSIGTVLSTNVTVGWGTYYSFTVSGDVAALLPSGTTLKVNGVTRGTSILSAYEASTNRTTVGYSPALNVNGNAHNAYNASGADYGVDADEIDVSDTVLVTFTPAFQLVSYNFFRSPLDYQSFPFHMSGGLPNGTTASCDIKIVIGVYNAAYLVGGQPLIQNATNNPASDKIMGLEGVIMSLR